LKLWSLLLLLVLGMAGCQNTDRDLELELRQSFKNYLNALQTRREFELRVVMNVPGLKDYKEHVDNLYLTYLEEVAQGHVNFDAHGLVLARFLRLHHYRYSILDIQKSEDELKANMKISIHFAYDANISHSGLEEGTKIFIPGKPLGKVETIVIGGENPVPREQLSYLELEIKFRKTNFEGVWQVLQLDVVPGSPQFETSLKNQF